MHIYQKSLLHMHVYFAFAIVTLAIFLPYTAFALTNISTCSELQNITNDLDEEYVLANDIDCSGISNFTPIGSFISPFTGTLDGQGYAISNLSVSTTYAGLFANVGTGAVIENLGFKDPDIDGHTYSGVLTSYLEGGTISHVYVGNGTLACASAYCGGLVGYMFNASSAINSSYSNVAIGGGTHVGGIVGRFSTGTIDMVYATGAMNGSNKHGILGSIDMGVTPSVSNSFYDVDITTAANNNYGTPTSTAAMMTQSTFSGWDFSVTGDGTIGDWIMAGYPHLQMEHRTTITDVVELQLIAVDRTEDYTISGNIDAASTTNWNGGAGFDSIGDNSHTFTGSLDGNEYTISGLYINRPTEEYAALIGYIDGSGSISNIHLTEVDVTGDFIVGGIAGHSNGTISNVSFSGELAGDVVGGIVASNAGTITRARTEGTITGAESSSYIAGIVGNNNGTVANCYSSMNVSGTDLVGGLVGDNYNGGTIRYSYARGTVSGSTNVGGLVGRNSVYDDEIEEYAEGVVDSSFYDSTTSGQSDTDKGTGKTTAQMKLLATFTDTDTSGLDTAWDFVGTPYDDAGTSSTWEMDPAINSGYAFLAWEQSDSNAPSAVTSLTGSASNSDSTLSWTNPTASDFVSITVRRSTSSYPANVSSGTAVVSATTTTSITDISLADGVYYYSVFALDNTGNVSSAATVSVTIGTASTGNRGGGTFVLPGGTGKGAADRSVDMYETKHIGTISSEGINLLAYIHSTALFSLTESSSGRLGEHRLTITDLDLSEPQTVTLELASTPQTIFLKRDASTEVDLDRDGATDLSVTFAGLWNNRVELTLKATTRGTEETVTTPQLSEEHASASCPSPLFTRDMKKGYYGPSAMALQQYLNDVGTYVADSGPGSPGQETEYFGSLTEQALMKFQKGYSFAATGIFDFTTRKFLGCAADSASVVGASPSSMRDLKFGMSGDDVRQLQVYLNTNGFPVAKSGIGSRGNETTFFGELTRQAVIAFQTAKGIIPASGYVGPLTRQELR